jgi:hypothetical protein
MPLVGIPLGNRTCVQNRLTAGLHHAATKQITSLTPCTRLTIKSSFAVEGLALICAERTRETRRFQSSSAPRVLYGTGREQQELKPRCRVARNCAEKLRAGSSPTLVS